MSKNFLWGLLILILSANAPAHAKKAKIIKADDRTAVVKHQYLVTFDLRKSAAASDTAESLTAEHGGKILHTYDQSGFHGATIRMSAAKARAMAKSPLVVTVEENVFLRIDADQANPTWGLDRLDEREFFDDDNYHYDYTGTGVVAFVFDTGIRETHDEFKNPDGSSRVSQGIDCTGEGIADANGHGTHVAGTLGSNTYGVAKEVDLVSVKVCLNNGDCAVSDVLCGINYVNSQKQSDPEGPPNSAPMIANLSFSGSNSATLNTAVEASIAKGVVYVTSAGNDRSNACSFSPGSSEGALTIGASTRLDETWEQSNFGDCVDLYAPGEAILSTAGSSDFATRVQTGTSMAAPHVAGAVALILEQFPALTPQEVAALLASRATAGFLNPAEPESPDLLLYALDEIFDPSPDPGDPPNSVLMNHVPVEDLSGTKDDASIWTVDLPSGAENLKIRINGKDGDADLYVRFGQDPTLLEYDCRPYLGRSKETCTFPVPQEGAYHIMIYGFSDYDRLELSADYVDAGVDCAGSLSPAPPLLGGDAGDEHHFEFIVDECATVSTTKISGGTGDADLYVRHGSAPSASGYDCRPYLNDSNEECTFLPAIPATQYIMVRGFSEFSGVLLEADYR